MLLIVCFLLAICLLCLCFPVDYFMCCANCVVLPCLLFVFLFLFNALSCFCVPSCFRVSLDWFYRVYLFVVLLFVLLLCLFLLLTVLLGYLFFIHSNPPSLFLFRFFVLWFDLLR